MCGCFGIYVYMCVCVLGLLLLPYVPPASKHGLLLESGVLPFLMDLIWSASTGREAYQSYVEGWGGSPPKTNKQHHQHPPQPHPSSSSSSSSRRKLGEAFPGARSFVNTDHEARDLAISAVATLCSNGGMAAPKIIHNQAECLNSPLPSSDSLVGADSHSGRPPNDVSRGVASKVEGDDPLHRSPLSSRFSLCGIASVLRRCERPTSFVSASPHVLTRGLIKGRENTTNSMHENHSCGESPVTRGYCENVQYFTL